MDKQLILFYQFIGLTEINYMSAVIIVLVFGYFWRFRATEQSANITLTYNHLIKLHVSKPFLIYTSVRHYKH